MRIAVSLLPGLLFLAGAAIALVLIPFNGWAFGVVGPTTRRPALVEEICKALPILHWIARNRAGFAIDAGVLGFSVGARKWTTSVFLDALSGSSILPWICRCGTAERRIGTAKSGDHGGEGGRGVCGRL